MSSNPGKAFLEVRKTTKEKTVTVFVLVLWTDFKPALLKQVLFLPLVYCFFAKAALMEK